MAAFPYYMFARRYALGTPRWRALDSGVASMALGNGVLRARDELGQALWAVDLRLEYLSESDQADLMAHWRDHGRGVTLFDWTDVLKGPLAESAYETFQCRYDPANPPRCVPADGAYARWHADVTLLPAVPTESTGSLSAHWTLDEGGVLLVGTDEALEVGTDEVLSLGGGTEIFDVSGHAHTGTASGDTDAMQAEGKLSGALTFDGVDDYIAVPDSADLRLDEGGSIVAWIYPTGLGESDGGRIVDKSTGVSAQAGYYFALAASNKLAFRASGDEDATLSSPSAITLSVWNFVGVSFGPYGRKLYVNGVDVTASGGDSTVLPPSSTAALRIGNRAGATDRSFAGRIDDVRIYHRPLSEYEHGVLYNGGSGTAEEVIP